MRRIDLLTPSGEQFRAICRRFGRKIFRYRQVKDILPGTATLTMMQNAHWIHRLGRRTTKDSFDWQTTKEAWDWLFSRGELDNSRGAE